jgi:kynurenine formamidase
MLETGGWIDLTQRTGDGMPHFAYLEPPKFERMRFPIPVETGEGTMQVTSFSMLSHLGTHLDAPRHFYPDGEMLDRLPVERFLGPAVVWDIPCEAPREIAAAELSAAEPAMRPGDIVIVHTGWAARYGTPEFHDYPWLSGGASRWLADRGARIVAVDVLSVDPPGNRRPAGFVFPAHRTLLGAGVLILENADPRAVVGRRGFAAALPMKLADADGAPARLIFRPDRGAPR